MVGINPKQNELLVPLQHCWGAKRKVIEAVGCSPTATATVITLGLSVFQF